MYTQCHCSVVHCLVVGVMSIMDVCSMQCYGVGNHSVVTMFTLIVTNQ